MALAKGLAILEAFDAAHPEMTCRTSRAVSACPRRPRAGRSSRYRRWATWASGTSGSTSSPGSWRWGRPSTSRPASTNPATGPARPRGALRRCLVGRHARRDGRDLRGACLCPARAPRGSGRGRALPGAGDVDGPRPDRGPAGRGYDPAAGACRCSGADVEDLHRPLPLREEIARVRENGYATTVDQLDYGITALAVPIRDPEGAPSPPSIPRATQAS
jgi:IclR family pca regulon transcriptional regulator